MKNVHPRFWKGMVLGGVMVIVFLGIAWLRHPKEKTSETIYPISTEEKIDSSKTDSEPLNPSAPKEASQPISYSLEKETVQRYFDAFNQKDFTSACSLLDQKKCNGKNPPSVKRFSEEYDKMRGGYESIELWVPKVSEVPSTICVKTTYEYQYDLRPKKVIETLRYVLSPRLDGSLEIKERICEEKIFSNGEIGQCPQESIRKFCVGTKQ